MEFEEPGGLFEVVGAAVKALGLKLAELLQRLLKLAGEACAVEAERGEGAVQFSHAGLHIPASLAKQIGFERGDAVETPSGIGEFLGELSFGRSGGLVFVEEPAAVLLVGGLVFAGQDRAAAGEAMAQGVMRGASFAFGRAGAGGVLGICLIDGGAIDCGAVDGWKS